MRLGYSCISLCPLRHLYKLVTIQITLSNSYQVINCNISGFRVTQVKPNKPVTLKHTDELYWDSTVHKYQ